MNIDTYLSRIRFSQPAKPNRETLKALVRAHLNAVPFENLDQQSGLEVSIATDRAYEKIVLRERGGWCFELNGLFAWLLKEIGFEVSMLAGHVGMDKPGVDTLGDHMVLLVDCDGPLLVDVGFGGGQYGPVPLQPGAVTHVPYTISISEEGGGWFRYSQTADQNEEGFWFTLDRVEASYFEPASRHLQTDPNSGFRRTLTAQRRLWNKHVVLRGFILKTIDESGTRATWLSDETSLVECLLSEFNLDVPQIAAQWPRLRQHHKELFETSSHFSS
jgi:N-hydroxyarylamine O-acetyltransferase